MFEDFFSLFFLWKLQSLRKLTLMCFMKYTSKVLTPEHSGYKKNYLLNFIYKISFTGSVRDTSRDVASTSALSCREQYDRHVQLSTSTGQVSPP